MLGVRNCSKLIERNLFTIIDLLPGAKSILLYVIWRVGDDFHKKISNLNVFSI